MSTCTSGPRRQRTTIAVAMTALALALVLALVPVGAGCSKATKKKSTGKTGMVAEASKPAMRQGNKEIGRIVLQRVDDDKKGTAAKEPLASNPTEGKPGPGQKPRQEAVSSRIVAGPNTPPPTVTSATIKPTLNAIFGLNVARIRKTFLWKAALSDATFQKIFRGKPYRVITKAIGLDPTQVTDELVVAFGSRTWNFASPEYVVAIFKGRFDAAKVMAALRKLPAGVLGNTKSIRVAGKEGLAVSTPGFLPFILIAVKKNVFAFTSVSLAPNVAKQLPGFGDADMAVRLRKINRKALLWTTFGRLDTLFATLRLSANLGPIGQITGGAFVVDPKGSKYNAEVHIETASLQAAEGLMTLVAIGQAAFAAGGSKGAPPLMVSLIEKLKIAQRKSAVVAGVTLSKADAKAVAAVLLRMMR